MLAHSFVTAAGVKPKQWILFLHGILGSGSNLRKLAQAAVSSHPAWGAILVDLRMHGRSQDRSPPHSFEAASYDLDELILSVEQPVLGVLGHSFGGKVALHFAERHRDILTKVWILDANPGINRHQSTNFLSASTLLQFLEQLPREFSSRDVLIKEIEAAGYTTEIAQWIAMNFERCEHGVRSRLDLQAVNQMLQGYWYCDFWPFVEQHLPNGCMYFILGARSTTLDENDRKRLEELQQKNPEKTCVYSIAQAGHWVHIDAPNEVENILIHSLEPM